MAGGKTGVDSLDKIAAEVRVCTRCPLSRSRTNAVPGEGAKKAQVMLIGEGPGYNEDKQGRPFVGAAGTFLNQMLASGGFRREDVFITNIVKCRPPQNRDPLPAEIAACEPYLDRQLALIQPSVVATLGRHSMMRYFPGERISRIHGQPKVVEGRTIVPLFHPAAALHQPALKQTELDDFARLPEILTGTGAPAADAPRPRPAAAQSASDPGAAPPTSVPPDQFVGAIDVRTSGRSEAATVEPQDAVGEGREAEAVQPSPPPAGTDLRSLRVARLRPEPGESEAMQADPEPNLSEAHSRRAEPTHEEPQQGQRKSRREPTERDAPGQLRLFE